MQSMIGSTRHLLLCFLFTIIVSNFLFAQNSAVKSKNDSTKFFKVDDKNPEFPSGENAMLCFLQNNLNIQILQSIQNSGLIVASFLVDTTGDVLDVKIIKPLNPSAENEFMRVIKLMPKWKPGEFKNKIVPVTMNLPLRLPYDPKNWKCIN
jgi:protein TonB